MNSPTNWEFFKQDQDRIIWVHICTEDLDEIAISINNWWKKRYPNYKIRVVSKNEFEQIKTIGLELGFSHVMSAPLVRSSYIAEEGYNECFQKSHSTE